MGVLEPRLVQVCEWLRLAAGVAHTLERLTVSSAKDDISLRVPVSILKIRRFGDSQRYPSSGFDLLDRPGGIESDPFTVGRPKYGARRAFGSGKRPRSDGVDRSEPDDRTAGRIEATVSEQTAVGRGGWQRAVLSVECDVELGGTAV